MTFLDSLRQSSAPRNNALIPDSTRTSPDRADFLRLLTAQLANQDPLDPADSSAFVEQLATFSSLEQLENIKGSVDNLAVAQASVVSATAVDFAGRMATVATDKVQFDGENAVTLATFTPQSGPVRATIKDATGKVVREMELGQKDAGISHFEWDGLDNDGNRLNEGNYKLEVEVIDGDETVAATALIRARVEAVAFDRGFAELRVLGDRYGLGDILEIG